jgi:predicted nucleotidyltransferase
VTEASEHLRALARRLVSAYAGLSPRAALLVGSAARGDSDESSDVDLLLYYDETQPTAALETVRRSLGAKDIHFHAADDGSVADFFELDGVQCQTMHEPVATFDRELERYCVELEASEMLPKIVMGLHEGLPLLGEQQVERWREAAKYTDGLQRAELERRWSFFPWWYTADRLRVRDTTIWRHDVLVGSAYALVGSLAALNRVWFSTFEFKHEREYLERLEAAPPNLAERLLSLFERDEAGQVEELERLVAETATLVKQRFPDFDVDAGWRGASHAPGQRFASWRA